MKPLEILKQLKLDYLRKEYPSLPEHAIKQPKYSDKSSNGLTHCIVDFLNLSGHLAERHSNEGRVIDNRKTYTDVIGQTKTIGSVKRIKSNQVNGTSDLKAIINGKMIAIEIKFGNDRQSEAQKKYQDRVESAGAQYWIAKTFDQFYEMYLNYLQSI